MLTTGRKSLWFYFDMQKNKLVHNTNYISPPWCIIYRLVLTWTVTAFNGKLVDHGHESFGLFDNCCPKMKTCWPALVSASCSCNWTSLPITVSSVSNKMTMQLWSSACAETIGQNNEQGQTNRTGGHAADLDWFKLVAKCIEYLFSFQGNWSLCVYRDNFTSESNS